MSKTQDQSPKTVTAIILAAGRSRRMGAFKPLLKFGESTVIDRSLQNFRDAGVDDFVVVSGHREDELKKHLPSSVVIVNNPDPDGEMSSSIVLGVQAVPSQSQAVLITPVDLPAVPPDVVTHLLTRWKAGAKLVVPEHDARGGHPVLIDLAFRQELLNLNHQLNGLRGFFGRHEAGVVRLPVNSPYIARDMDTWDDYVALHQEVFGTAPAEQKPADNA